MTFAGRSLRRMYWPESEKDFVPPRRLDAARLGGHVLMWSLWG
jgi:hypothetical protein